MYPTKLIGWCTGYLLPDGDVKKLLTDMSNKDVIQPSLSPWASPIVVIGRALATTG